MSSWSFLTRQLKSLTKTELFSLIDTFTVVIRSAAFEELSNSDLQTKKKDSIVAAILQLLKKNADFETAEAHLKLYLVYCRRNQRVWTLYRLKGNDGSHQQSVQRLEEQLRKQPGSKYNAHATIHTYDDAWWMRIMLRPRKGDGQYQVEAYVVHRVERPYIAMSKLSKSRCSTILKVLKNVLGFREASVTKLIGKNIESLFALCENTGACDPAVQIAEQRDASTADSSKEFSDDEQIVDVDEEYKQSRMRYAEAKFGRYRELKPIRKLTFELHTTFGAMHLVPEMANSPDPLVHCKVKFRGPDVMRGIRQMVEQGIATGPLPEYLTDAPASGCTRIVVRDEEI